MLTGSDAIDEMGRRTGYPVPDALLDYYAALGAGARVEIVDGAESSYAKVWMADIQIGSVPFAKFNGHTGAPLPAPDLFSQDVRRLLVSNIKPTSNSDHAIFLATCIGAVADFKARTVEFKHKSGRERRIEWGNFGGEAEEFRYIIVCAAIDLAVEAGLWKPGEHHFYHRYVF